LCGDAGLRKVDTPTGPAVRESTMNAKRFTDVGLAFAAVGILIGFISMLNIVAFTGTGLDKILVRYYIECACGFGIYLVGIVCDLIGLYIEDSDRMETVPLMEVVVR